MQTVSYKNINRLALPAIASGIVESVLSLTDMLVVGRVTLDTVESVAAVGLVGTILSSFVWVFAQSQNALSTIISQYLGAGKLKRTFSLIPQALALNFMIGLVICFIGWRYVHLILGWFNAEDKLLNYAASYWRIRILGFPLTLLSFILFGAFRGVQNTYWAFICSLTGAITNAILTIILVHGWGDKVLAMHVNGAAWGSLISQSVILMMAVYFYIFKSPLKISWYWRPHPELKRFLHLSFDFILRTASLNLAMYIANSLATSLGPRFIASHVLIMNLWMFFAFFLDGYAHAGNAMSGKMLGERNYAGIMELSRKVSKASVLLAVGIIVLCGIFYPWIPMLFTSEQTLIDTFYQFFWLAILIQPINALAFAYDGIYKGLGEAKVLRNNIAIATFLGFIPAAYLLFYLGAGMYAIWAGFYIWMSIRSFPLKRRLEKKYGMKG